MNYDDRDVEPRGEHLRGKKIDFIVSGGVGAIESPKWIRELRRYGAEVEVFLTPGAKDFVSPMVFEWASKKPAVVSFEGDARHLSQADAVVIAPCTLDFLSKMAVGISDHITTTLVQSVLGRKPVFILPSMHQSLQQSPFFQKHCESLSAVPNVVFLKPHEEEGKMKMPEPGKAVMEISHFLCPWLQGKSSLVLLGPTRAYLDEVRYLTNPSTGALGFSIAEELYRSGMDVETLGGVISSPLQPLVPFDSIETNEELEKSAEVRLDQKSFDLGVFAAAVLDFDVRDRREGKQGSQEEWVLHLVPSKKIIETLAPRFPYRVGFKLESQTSEDDLKEKMIRQSEVYQCQWVVGNLLEGVGTLKHEALLWAQHDQDFQSFSTKQEIAQALRRAVQAKLTSS